MAKMRQSSRSGFFRSGRDVSAHFRSLTIDPRKWWVRSPVRVWQRYQRVARAFLNPSPHDLASLEERTVSCRRTWDRWLQAAAQADDEALASLVRLHHDRVYRFGLRVCRDGFDADDAVQEAFVKLAARRDVVGDQSALAWLLTVVRNACLRLLRPFERQRRVLAPLR